MDSVNSLLDTSSLGLRSLHREGLEAMAHFQHRIWSIKVKSDVRFKIGTRCTNEDTRGRKPCKGSIRIKLTEQGPYLEIAKFYHDKRCPKAELTCGTCHTLEDKPCNDPKFCTNVFDYLSKAFESSKKNHETQVQKRKVLEDEAIKNNWCVPCTPFEAIHAGNLKRDIVELNQFIGNYYADRQGR